MATQPRSAERAVLALLVLVVLVPRLVLSKGPNPTERTIDLHAGDPCPSYLSRPETGTGPSWLLTPHHRVA